MFCLFLSFLLTFVASKDPAEGWLGYAKGTNPNGGDDIITYMEAKWAVADNPKRFGAFFSPWFGIETSDNMNLLQPVNPWSGYSWSIYNEYFQWDPMHNENSDSIRVHAGDIVFGSVTYNPNNHTYTAYHSLLKTGDYVTLNIPVQKVGGTEKKYTIAYFVMEKEWRCDQYPPDGKVTFYDIKIEYANKQVTPKWETSYVDDVCHCRAHILNSTTVDITWST